MFPKKQIREFKQILILHEDKFSKKDYCLLLVQNAQALLQDDGSGLCSEALIIKENKNVLTDSEIDAIISLRKFLTTVTGVEIDNEKLPSRVIGMKINSLDVGSQSQISTCLMGVNQLSKIQERSLEIDISSQEIEDLTNEMRDLFYFLYDFQFFESYSIHNESSILQAQKQSTFIMVSAEDDVNASQISEGQDSIINEDECQSPQVRKQQKQEAPEVVQYEDQGIDKQHREFKRARSEGRNLFTIYEEENESYLLSNNSSIMIKNRDMMLFSREDAYESLSESPKKNLNNSKIIVAIAEEKEKGLLSEDEAPIEDVLVQVEFSEQTKKEGGSSSADSQNNPESDLEQEKSTQQNSRQEDLKQQQEEDQKVKCVEIKIDAKRSFTSQQIERQLSAESLPLQQQVDKKASITALSSNNNEVKSNKDLENEMALLRKEIESRLNMIESNSQNQNPQQLDEYQVYLRETLFTEDDESQFKIISQLPEDQENTILNSKIPSRQNSLGKIECANVSHCKEQRIKIYKRQPRDNSLPNNSSSSLVIGNYGSAIGAGIQSMEQQNDSQFLSSFCNLSSSKIEKENYPVFERIMMPPHLITDLNTQRQPLNDEGINVSPLGKDKSSMVSIIEKTQEEGKIQLPNKSSKQEFHRQKKEQENLISIDLSKVNQFNTVQKKKFRAQDSVSPIGGLDIERRERIIQSVKKGKFQFKTKVHQQTVQSGRIQYKTLQNQSITETPSALNSYRSRAAEPQRQFDLEQDSVNTSLYKVEKQCSKCKGTNWIAKHNMPCSQCVKMPSKQELCQDMPMQVKILDCQ